MRIEKNNIFEIQEETEIKQGDRIYTLEKGDKVELISESVKWVQIGSDFHKKTGKKVIWNELNGRDEKTGYVFKREIIGYSYDKEGGRTIIYDEDENIIEVGSKRYNAILYTIDIVSWTGIKNEYHKGMTRKKDIFEIQEELRIASKDKIYILEKGDKIEVIQEKYDFESQLLGRLISDAKYCLGPSKTTKFLWTHPVSAFIDKMKELYFLLKPDDSYLSMRMIQYYEKELLKLEAMDIRKYGPDPWSKR